MTVPDDLLLAFFEESSSRLLEIDAAEAVSSTSNKNAPFSPFGLDDCRRCVLDQQLTILEEVTNRYRDQSVDEGSGDVTVTVTATATATQVQERLGRLQQEPNLSRELKLAMESMNDAARLAVCKLALYSEEDLTRKEPSASSSSRTLQDEGRLDRTKMMEYFGLCQAALKLPCVTEFMVQLEKDSIFQTTSQSDDDDGGGGDQNGESKASSVSAAMMFPQSRLEYVQRLLAKGMGWDPVFVTSELRKIFVQKPKEVDYDYYDGEVMSLFQKLVEEMTVAIRAASLQIRSKQDMELMNDLGKGGSTRVVSVQYSEFEVDQNGKKIESSSQNNAPEGTVDEREKELSEEDKKQRLRLASEAAILQQTMLGELLSMSEEERTHTLNEAAETSKKFMEEVMALPPGQERIDFLTGMDPKTSRQLAMHKLWNGMLQANGGQAPKIVRQK